MLDYLKSARSRLESEVLLRYRTLKSRGVEDTQKPPISHLLVFELRERGREKCFRPPLSVHAGVAVTGSSKVIRDLDFSAGLERVRLPSELYEALLDLFRCRAYFLRGQAIDAETVVPMCDVV